jgi:hypothetical protein
MALAKLGMEYVNEQTGFYAGNGIVRFIEHLGDGTKAEFTLENVFPFTSIADIKRMIWIHEEVQGAVSYTPKFVFMAYQKGELYSPVEFYWPKNTGLPEAFEDPLVAEFVPNPNLVDAEGNRRTFSPHLNLSLTLEDSLRSNAININEVIIHIWRLNQILQEDPSQVTASLFAGFIRLYFPLLDDIEILDDAMSNEADEASESYAACQVYVGDRQQQLMHLQDTFKGHNGLNLISCRSIESLHVKIPKILPLPESLEILFFELKLSSALPYLRYFSDTPDQEPIMRYLKDVYLPPNILSNWLKELPETKNKVIVGKVLIRGSKIPLGSAFDIAFLSDNTNTAKLETTRKDSPYPGHTVEEGLLELRGFIENNTFNHEFEPLELSYLHGRFNWKHPNPTSPKPSIAELKRRIEKYSHLFDIEPTDPAEPSALKLRYRAVSNYESENEIFRYISRLLALKVTEKDVRKAETTEYVITELGKRFGRGRDQAQTDYLAYLERSGQFKAAVQGGGDDAVPAYHDGVFVSLRNTHPEYEIEVANVQEKTSCSRIFTTLVVMLLEGTEVIEGPKLETGSAIVAEAKTAARQAADAFFQEKLGGVDQYSCGFAWVEIHGIKGNTKMGKALKAAGVKQNYTRAFSIWNPSEHNCQNIDTKEAGAEAAQKVFEKYGFCAYAGSRLD